MTRVPVGGGRGDVRRCPGLRALAGLLAVPVLLLVGCGGTRQNDAVAPAAGHYPIATAAPQVLATPVVSDGHYQLVAAGEPVVVRRAGAVAVVDAAGPDLSPVAVAAGQAPVQHAPGTLTVTVRPESGRLDVQAAGFLALDEAKNRIPLRADRASSSVAPGHPGTLRLRAVFPAGHATLTWQPAGKPLVTWDFMVELD